MSANYVLSAKQAAAFGESMLGGKANNMAWLSRNGLPVPNWFVLTTDAFTLQMKFGGLDVWLEQQLEKIHADESQLIGICTEIRERISAGPLAPELIEGFQQALQAVDPKQDQYFAVRSSALGEDAEEASFAGQMDSFLFQRGAEAISQSILDVFASAFTDRAVAYRLRHGMNLLETKAAVIVQKMINGEVSGVFFTAHPVSGSRQQGLISACYGSGEGIVSGLCNTDEFSVKLDGSVDESLINEKDVQLIFDAESDRGTIEVEVEAGLRNVACINEQQLAKLNALGRTIAEKKLSPQDIEWALLDNEIYILQTRPVTSLPAPAQPKGERLVWDNSNIQESYCGVTTPLTFSFAQRGYAAVYKQTYSMLGMSAKQMKQLDPVLNNMLGLINGRIYYNINNWYRALLVLPGFKTNKADMERMMGLQDPVDLVEEQELSRLQRLAKLPSTFNALFRLLMGFRQLKNMVPAFRARFESVYAEVDRGSLHTLEMADLLKLLKYLHDELTGKWEAPIFNDFYVMMMNGKVNRWLEDVGLENPSLVQNNLMSGEEGIESTEPTKMLLRMCDLVRAEDPLRQLLEDTPNDSLLDALQVRFPPFYELCLEYIERYGDRSIGELKLESVTLRQDPSFIFSVLKNFLTREDLTLETLAANEMKFRGAAEEEAFTAVQAKFGSRKLRKFKRDLQKLRDSVKNRENMRLARTRAFGLAREAYLEIGKQLSLYDLLEDARDIFYLHVDELDAYMEGASVQTQWKSLVAGRKEEFAAYEDDEPAHHFSTYGPVYHHNSFEYVGDQQVQESEELLKGIGCYPGVVEQPIKLIFSPEDELTLDGQILCTVRTDPGWAPLFPTAGGILVERGSTLSHSAVVARELGIPAVVNIPGLTKMMENGERVRMDGGKGTIERLDFEATEEEGVADVDAVDA